jgi:membrane protease YdiL (CAAX protease family)
MTTETSSPPSPPPSVWSIFLTFLIATFAILVASVFAGMVLHSLDPDVPPIEALQGLKGLIAGALASSTALVFTLAFATRGVTLARLRLVPGRESGFDLFVALVGVLSLGQVLDSATTLAGLGTHGSMSAIRRALHGASGPELFLAVVTIGIVAGAAEELFFRGYMQSMLRERWGPRLAVLVTALCFGALHMDPVHAPLAVALGVYLGYLTERAGSALPAIVCHVVNNAVYTVITALVGSFGGRDLNLALGGVGAVLFILCLMRLHSSLSSPATAVSSAADQL